MVLSQPFDAFELLAEDYRSEAYVAYRACCAGSTTKLRLTLFHQPVSESPRFRAAFRKDQPSLGSMEHPHLLGPVGWGEDGGLLFYVTEYPAGTSLADRLAQTKSYTWDEFIDLGWQIASALQHAHNVGLTHGHLTTSSVAVTDEVRCKVMGFGLYRWIAAATSQNTMEPLFAEQTVQDLTDLGHILEAVFHSLSPDAMHKVDEQQVTAMSELIKDLQHPTPDLLARDVQGRLGNMLLQVSGESIKMVDHRKGQQLSRRSIVDELFDEPGSGPTALPAPMETQERTAPSPSTAIVVVAVVILLLVILGLFALLSG